MKASQQLNSDAADFDRPAVQARGEGSSPSPALEVELAAADRLFTVDKAVSALAHELAQPLTSIANYANACVRLLQAGTTSREELLEAMQEAAAEALRANEVMRRAQLRPSHRNSSLVRTSLNDLVRDVVATLPSEIASHKIAVSLRWPTVYPKCDWTAFRFKWCCCI